MTFDATITVRALKRALSLAVPSTPKGRTALDVLKAVRLSAHAGFLSVDATDLDHSVRVAGIVTSSGSGGVAVVNGARLLAAVKELPAGETVRLRQQKDATVLRIETQAGLLTLAAPFPEQDWPAEAVASVARDDDALRQVVLDSKFAAALKRIKPFISDEETRYYLNGVFVHEWNDGSGYSDSSIAVVATDGRRLGRVTGLGNPAGVGNRPGLFDGSEQPNTRGFILPVVAVDAFLRLFGGLDSVTMTLELGIDRSSARTGGVVRARFEAGEGALVRSLITKLIDGTYPDYRAVIPSDFEQTVTVDRVALDQALKLARVTLGGAYMGSLSVQADGEVRRLVIDATTGDGDGALLPLAVIEASEAFKPIGLNMTYLRDILGAATGDEVRLDMGDPGAPILLTEGDFLSVLMPMRLGGDAPRSIALMREAA